MTTCTYVLLAGLPGTGKSTLAAELAATSQPSVILNKDTVRAALFPDKATDYSEVQNDICMQAMLASAAYLAKTKAPPQFIFFDGRTFSRATHIKQVIESAVDSGAPCTIIHLWCSDEVALSRLEGGDAGHPAKNRDAALYVSLKQSFEPIMQPHLSIDTGLPIEQSLTVCRRYLE